MEVRLLGALEVLDGGRPVAVRGAKQRALLALLALAVPHAVSDERLLEELWEEGLPEAPRNALQKQVSQLRRAIGADGIERGPAGYRLAADADHVDALAFERAVREGRRAVDEGRWSEAATVLRQALAPWRGPALDDLRDATFAGREAVRLEGLRMDAVELRMEAELALGRHGEVAAELEALVSSSPLRERLRGQLMLALYRSGRQADALEAFQRGRRVLAEELGLDPGPELRALEAAILAQDPALALGAGDVPEGAPPTPAPPPPTPTVPFFPLALSSFVGREAELEQVRARLAEHRLVTVTGPGGAGKTRLSLEVGGALRATLPVAFVELAPVGPGPAVAEAVAEAVGARDAGAQHGPARPVERVVRHLGGSSCVLVLDNCEHVLADSARLAADVLTACPDVRVLATSREPLGVPGEVQLAVGPLDPEHAEQLFANRATAGRPDFVLDERTRPHVAEICRRLDGLPLALELAAARVKALPVEHIARRLDDRFRLLTGGDRTALARHQTLRAAVEWSYDLLFEDERTVFTRASVFAGSFDLDAAVAVCSPGDELGELEVLDLVTRLVDKSLLVRRGDRYVMLDTLRQFGAEQLAAAGIADEVRRAHAQHFAARAEAASPHVFTRGQVPWLERLEADHDDFRAAIDWSLGAAPDLAMALVSSLAAPWWIRGHGAEARRALDAVLEVEHTPSSARARALRWGAQLSDATGWSERPGEAERELAQAVRRVEEAMATAERIGDAVELGHAHRLLSVIIVREAGFQRSSEVLERATEELRCSADTFRALGDEWAVAFAGVIEAFAALACGQPERVPAISAGVEPTLRRLGDRFALDRLLLVEAMRAESEGDVAAATGLHREGLRLCTELGFEEGRVGHLLALAALGAPEGDPGVARRRLEALDELGAGAAARAAAGDLALREGDLERASALHLEALDRYRALGLSAGAPSSLLALAEIAETRGDVEQAEELRRLAAREHEVFGAPDDEG